MLPWDLKLQVAMQIIVTRTLYGFAKKSSYKSYYTWFFALSQQVFSKLYISCRFEHLRDTNEAPIDCQEPFLPAPFNCITSEIFT